MPASRDRDTDRTRTRRRLRWLAGLAIAAEAIGAAVYYQRVLRPRWHDWGATVQERHQTYRGDDRIAHARDRSTYAITIEAPPADVWPWIVQMGTGRAGWYSYDNLDNGGHPSATRILPEHQHLQRGDVIPVDPKGKMGFPVVDIEPERHLVLGAIVHTADRTPVRVPGAGAETLWALHLVPEGEHTTRLVVRTAGEPSAHRIVDTATAPMWETVVFFMQRKQLLSIKERAEALHRSHAPVPAAFSAT